MTLVRFDSCYLQMAVPTIHQRLLEGCAAQTPAAAALATLVGVASHQREKLEEDPSRPELLLTEPGVGYRVKVEG
jgi:DNA-binding response OmpR family regulator